MDRTAEWPWMLGPGRGACAWVLAAASCGDFDLQPRTTAREDMQDTWDDPWANGDTDEVEPDPSHAGRLGSCERAALAERPYAFDEEDRLALEQERLACTTVANDDAIAELRVRHPDGHRVDEGVEAHRRFSSRLCDLLVSASYEPSPHIGPQCEGDLELTLGRLIGAHGGLEERIVALARHPWLYPSCSASPEVDAWVACIDDAVTGRFERVARELEHSGVATSDDVEILGNPRAVADVTCTIFPPPTVDERCPADWLVLGRDVLDRHVEW